jgi:hypothetical protein
MNRIPYKQKLERQKLARDEAQNIILRRQVTPKPLMSNARFEQYVKTVTKNQDQNSIGRELLRLELINRRGGFELPENIRIQKIESINQDNDRVKKLMPQMSVIGALNNLNMNLTGVPSRQLNYEYAKYQFAIDIATQNNIAGFRSETIIIIDMGRNQYAVTSAKEIIALTDPNYVGIQRDYQIFLRSVFMSRSVIFMYLPNPDTLTARLNDICTKVTLNTVLEKIVNDYYAKSSGGPQSTIGSTESAFEAMRYGAKPETQLRGDRISLGEVLSDTDEQQKYRLAVREFETKYLSFFKDAITNTLIDRTIVHKKQREVFKKQINEAEDKLKKLKDEKDEKVGTYDIINTTRNQIAPKYRNEITKQVNANKIKKAENKKDIVLRGVTYEGTKNIMNPADAVREIYRMVNGKLRDDYDEYQTNKKGVENEIMVAKQKYDRYIREYNGALATYTRDIIANELKYNEKLRNDIITKYKIDGNTLIEFNKAIDNVIQTHLKKVEKEAQEIIG